jgi:hypothetical protein
MPNETVETPFFAVRNAPEGTQQTCFMHTDLLSLFVASFFGFYLSGSRNACLRAPILPFIVAPLFGCRSVFVERFEFCHRVLCGIEP